MFIIAVLTLIISVGWLDVIRGRELAVLRADQQWIVREMIRIHEDVERLKRERYGPYTQ